MLVTTLRKSFAETSISGVGLSNNVLFQCRKNTVFFSKSCMDEIEVPLNHY